MRMVSLRGFLTLNISASRIHPFATYRTPFSCPSTLFFAPCYILSIIAVGIFYFLGRNTRLTPSFVNECSLSMNRSWSITTHVIRTMQVFDNMHTCFLELAHRAVVGESCGLPPVARFLRKTMWSLFAARDFFGKHDHHSESARPLAATFSVPPNTH